MEMSGFSKVEMSAFSDRGPADFCLGYPASRFERRSMLGSALRQRWPLRALAALRWQLCSGGWPAPTGRTLPRRFTKRCSEVMSRHCVPCSPRGPGSEVTDAEGLTPLEVAARTGQQEALALLLRSGAGSGPSSPPDLARPTPLYYASWGGHAELVEWLIEQGADLSRGAAGGWTPFTRPPRRATDAVAERLLAHGASLESRTAGGWTPLYLAARAGHAELALFLLARGADADPPLPRGWTVLHAAAQGDHEGLVDALLTRGARIDAVTDEGLAPLHLAAFGGSPAVAKLLLDRGADPPRARAANGSTPLHAAAAGGHRAVADLLLARGADVDARDVEGRTPLLRAAQAGEAEMAAQLLMRGADPNLPTASGATPLHVVARNHTGEFAELLLRAGADPNAPSGEKMTPLHLRRPARSTGDGRRAAGGRREHRDAQHPPGHALDPGRSGRRRGGRRASPGAWRGPRRPRDRRLDGPSRIATRRAGGTTTSFGCSASTEPERGNPTRRFRGPAVADPARDRLEVETSRWERLLRGPGAPLAVVALAVLYQLPFFDRWFSFMDEGHILLYADIIANGGELYRDATVYPLPGAFYFLAWVFGFVEPSNLVARWIAMLEFAVFVGLVFVLLRKLVPPGWALAGVLLMFLYRIWAFPHWHMYNYSTTALLVQLAALLGLLRFMDTGQAERGSCWQGCCSASGCSASRITGRRCWSPWGRRSRSTRARVRRLRAPPSGPWPPASSLPRRWWARPPPCTSCARISSASSSS